MCGRFAFYSPSEATAALFGVSASMEVQPRYNIAPTQTIAAIRAGSNQELELFMLPWGLVPFWAKDPSIGNRMINARAETVAEKPSYRAAFRHRRCIVLADGFYEWHRQNDTKTPSYISLASQEPFALAGLWESWTDKQSGESLQTTTLITTEANEFMRPLHHRMPVVMQAATADEWLAGSEELLQQAADRTPAMQAWPVDRKVNNARNEGEELIDVAGDIIR
jgi:putative SOS response-associated peptidase YedK